MKRFNLYVVILLTCLLGTSSMAKAETIEVKQAGTLYALVGNKLNTMTELIVTGPLNGDDIACIRDMEVLEILNMRGASIVSGGGPYYGQLTTKTNIVGDKMFFGLSQLKKIVFPANVTVIGEYTNASGAGEESRGSDAVARCTSLEEVEFPAALKRIGSKAFDRCIRLKKVILPEGVEEIYKYAFMNCDALTSVSIPSTFSNNNWYYSYQFYDCDNLTDISLTEGIKELGYEMFYSCKSLTSIKLPESLTHINSAFTLCSSLASINIPNSVISIGNFSGCSALTTVVIPEGVISIGSFSDCTNLTSITLPSTLTSIGLFSNCTSLESIELPDGITELSDHRAFQGCTKLKSIKLPQKLNTIYQYAFAGCSSLVTIELPNRVTTLGKYAFQNCTALTSVILPRGIYSIEERTFEGCTALKSVSFPKDLQSIKRYAFTGCTSLETVEIPGNILSIEYNAFANCGIKHLVLGEGISQINDGVFSGCAQLSTIQFPSTMKRISGFSNTGLTEISLSENVQAIKPNAFANCNNLTKIDLSECAALDSIYGKAFSACKSLETVILPQGLKGLGESTFEGCNKLKHLTLSSALDTIHARTFYNCDSLRTVIIPEGVKRINASAFNSCDSLTTLSLPATLRELGADAFAATGITKVSIPEGVTTLRGGTFLDCRKLESATLPSTLTKIEDRSGNYGAFSNCFSLKTINFPQALTSIGSYTFYRCSSLESIELPGVIEIGDNAFYDCNKLQRVVFSPKLTSIGASAFRSCSFTSLELPASLQTIGENAFWTYNNLIHTVIWNSSSEIPKNVFSSITYLFLPNGVTGSNVNAETIIRNGLADSFEIKTASRYVDNRTIYYYVIPKAFKTKKAIYNRRFTQSSGIGTARGWETIVLPFDVNKFTYTGYSWNSGENIALAPFGSEALQTEGTRPFWLYEMTTEGPKRATVLKAHTPYLICMPNNSKYPSSSNINGNVSFTGEDETNGVLISETEGKLSSADGKEYNLVPTYETVLQSESVYALNIGNWYDEHQEGSVFIKNYRDVNPFYAYATPASTTPTGKAPKYFSIGGDGPITGMEEQLLITPDQLNRAYSMDGVVYVHCAKAQVISIYDANGRTVCTLNATEGNNEVRNLPDGIYFLEGQKVIVKH